MRTVCFFVSFDRILIRPCLNLPRRMSDVVPLSDVVPFYGGRDGTWEFYYGPVRYGEILDDEDPDAEELPAVDYGDIAYEKWTIRMSLRSGGVPVELWGDILDRRSAPLLRVMGDIIVFDTLLYRMNLSRSAHDEFDREIAYLYYHFLKGIMELGRLLLNFEVSDELVWDIARDGAYFIMCPYYEYEVIALDGDGYYAFRADDSDRDIEP